MYIEANFRNDRGGTQDCHQGERVNYTVVNKSTACLVPCF